MTRGDFQVAVVRDRQEWVDQRQTTATGPPTGSLSLDKKAGVDGHPCPPPPASICPVTTEIRAVMVSTRCCDTARAAPAQPRLRVSRDPPRSDECHPRTGADSAARRWHPRGRRRSSTNPAHQ